MTDYVSGGDPRRTMDLLWGDRRTGAPTPTRGPKPALTVAEIIAAAIAVADEEGLGALSMRKVGERLGKTAMALYTYVPGKAELLDLMVDTVCGELPTSYDLSGGWRPALERSTRDGWDLYQRHPWMLQIAGARAVLGPHVFDWYETQLRIVDGIGLDALGMTRVLGAVGGYLRGAAKAVADARSAEQATGISDDQWWNERAPLLEELGEIWGERYPVTSRLESEQAFAQADRDPDDDSPYTVREELDAFEFGLQRLLDGVEIFIERAR